MLMRILCIEPDVVKLFPFILIFVVSLVILQNPTTLIIIQIVCFNISVLAFFG